MALLPIAAQHLLATAVDSSTTCHLLRHLDMTAKKLSRNDRCFAQNGTPDSSEATFFAQAFRGAVPRVGTRMTRMDPLRG
jgi:hypothetical protein